MHEPSKSLVVSQACHDHEAIVKLLQDLRKAQVAQQKTAEQKI